MKLQFVAVSLLATLAAGPALSTPQAEASATAPVAPTATAAPTAPVVPLPAHLEEQRQALAERKLALEAEEREIAAEIHRLQEEAKQVDPDGRLTSDQLFALLQERQQLRAQQNDQFPFELPVLTSLMGFVAWLFAGYRKQRQLHETVRLMVEKGAEIPTGLIVAPPKRKPSDLRRGIILSTSGLGLTIFLGALPGAAGAWGAGVTLLLIGVGHLIVWRLQNLKGPWSSALATE
ncbi:DUF6249 domain-containing protein [Archangium sp.]|uniref:DUF6249 domain-containing protein n=1 Tax=Archangium sp. TaxID=1872627 RepID=UPI00286A824C|nr:DUF6249 domain-containing protein [Archangium sp.]